MDRLPRDAGDTEGKPKFIHFDFGDEGFAAADFYPDALDEGLIRISLNCAAGGDGAEGLLRFQQRCYQILTLHFAEAKVFSAQLTALDGGALCIPDVPLVTTHSHVAVTNLQEVIDFYDVPDSFWSAGWEVAARRDGQVLITRALDLLTGPDYLARIIDHQWTMARAAKPGETSYESFALEPYEEDVFRSGAARLEFTGYAADDRRLDYAGYLAEGQHVQGWEIFALRGILENKQSPDGEAPVDAVRIVFPEQWMAESEKRPLLDIGCEVMWAGSDGTLVRIEQ
ncbi:MAG: hypothetical protein ACKOPM_00565 [Novosphingobium sp.]